MDPERFTRVASAVFAFGGYARPGPLFQLVGTEWNDSAVGPQGSPQLQFSAAADMSSLKGNVFSGIV
ncbi:MAG: hypothetical protein BWY06_01866 [Candidatus Latescibacteria bacterium ADurb.Bin168]|nr:MAG: hypothetical protein BWY06_01866 [Candidatus Latescibacteria bacterium ADurb.Bin168]